MANENDYNYRRNTGEVNRPAVRSTHSGALSGERSGNAAGQTRNAGYATDTANARNNGNAVPADRNAGKTGGDPKNNKNVYLMRRIVFAAVVIAVIVLLIVLIVAISKAASKPKKPAEGPVMSAVAFEAGEYGPAAEQLLTETGKAVTSQGGRIEYETDITQINFHVLGVYKVILIFTDTDGTRSRHNVEIHVVDTVPPSGVAVDRYTVKGQPLSVADFIAPGSVRDETDVAVSFMGPEPDYNTEGTQTVNILLRDRGGNETKLTASLTVTAE